MHYSGKVKVRFKKSVLEPQGKAVELALHENGYENIQKIRVGKFIEVDLEASSKEEARKALGEIAEKVLYNPVMEVCDIEVEEGPSGN